MSHQDGLLWLSIVLLMIWGILLVSTSSVTIQSSTTQIAASILEKQVIFMGAFLAITLSLSLVSLKILKKILFFGFIFNMILMLWMSTGGGQISHGANRWMNFFGISIQPSEILKPCFISISAWLLSPLMYLRCEQPSFWGLSFKKCYGPLGKSFVLLLFIVILLFFQPDLGMSSIFMGSWIIQTFWAGMPLWILGMVIFGGLGTLGLAYLLLPHVHQRLQSFFFSSVMDRFGHDYQMIRSLEAFQQGGWFGKGFGDGQVKYYLPDASTDFILAVAGEEFGLVSCMFILICYAVLIGRIWWYAVRKKSPWGQLVLVGIAASLSFQVFVNVASATYLIPPKGMTLPFLSAGRSSLLSMALMIGTVLCLTQSDEN
jgi:cell division protein FtsW